MFMLTGCSFSQGEAIESIKGEIEKVDAEDHSVLVGCSDDMHLKKEDKDNLIQYLCTVNVSEETSVINEKTGERLSFSNLNVGQLVKVMLTRPQEVNKNQETRVMTAKEIIAY
ncbi:hypothetical protein GWK91_09530 [Virgibacillus sp. MSP4-1]|uniref:hypothetical protein n=1 Tax=Virgibacillus sp. MSP4-1 TaxID=2700081 RepID=UPI0005C63E1F|nr:hypothetical protein [Virgibacillus sp. MSP4-1]QHS23173.1 hypothetical protein GWK91_09530 [Virgibacillus sp. MSP4-1]